MDAVEQSPAPLRAGESTARIETVVVGGGQAGLAVACQLRRRGREAVVLDAAGRVGAAWRERWDSMRLFTPAGFDGLPGMPFPAPAWSLPTGAEMADYLEAYATRFDLDVRGGTRVDSVRPCVGGFLVEAGDLRVIAGAVVVATGAYGTPHVPPFAAGLRPAITQLHSRDYRRPSQLPPGPVLVVGAGNSGADVALDLAPDHDVTLAGRDVGQLPFDVTGLPARLALTRLLLRGVFHRVLTTRTPPGRRVRPTVLSRGGPLIRVRRRDLVAAGVERAPRVEGTSDGLPVLVDGRVLDVTGVVWCTGFRTDLSWLHVPGAETVAGTHDLPGHDRGVARGVPGLFFVGQPFLYALSSGMVHGVGRDADHVAAAIDRHVGAAARSATVRVPARTR